MSESTTTDLKGSIRRCGLVLLAVACTTAMMISVSFSNIGGWPVKVTAILAVAVVNAFLVAGFLMHLLSEKKMVYTVLSFTVCFFAGLLGLTLWAMQDFPVGTTH
jgi:heme/copper-type cytochrome/quinol oxidase subunit 4